MSSSAPAPAIPGKARILALVALLCLVWSSTWWAIRVCLEVQPPLSSAGARFAIAGIAMAMVTPWLRGKEQAPPPKTWLWIVCGATNFAGGYGVLYCAETVVPSGIAAVLWAVFPLLMAGSATMFLGERLSLRQWCGFGVSFAGIVAVFAGDLGGVGRDQLGYAWLVLLSPLIAAIGTTLVKKHGSHTSSVLLNRNGMLLGAALLLAAAFAREDPFAIAWTPRAIIATVYLAVFGTTLTFGVYFWLLRTAPAAMLSLINYVTPVLAMVFATLVGDGDHGLGSWLGAGLVTFGIALVVRR
ncbi:MAG TPA: hypothetical protein ENI87_14405 [bacterium]|nr:hypothetical protein [bacterium]